MNNEQIVATKILLHGNGINNSQDIIDDSIYNNTIIVSGSTKISTSQYVFNESSLNFNGSAGYLSINDNDIFHIGEKNWSIDFRIRFTSYPENFYMIFHQRESASKYIGIVFFNSIGLQFQCENDGTSYSISEDVNISSGYLLNTWYHIEITYINGYCYLFKNGILIKSQSCSIINFINLNANILIGKHASYSYYINGYIDEFRYMIGSNGHTENFTPPTEEYSITDIVNESDILINITSFEGYESNFDITIDFGFHAGLESDCYIEIDIAYDLNDYNFCNNCDFLIDIIPVGLFDSQSVTTEYTYDGNGNLVETVVINPETNEPLIIPPSEDEYWSCFGVRAYFQLPDSGLAYEISPYDLMNVNVKKGINQPIYWSFDIINADRKYSDPNGDYADLLTENLYVPSKRSRRFVAIVLMCVCGTKFKTLIFPRLVMKEIIGTEIISVSGIDEISEYLSRNVTLESYCCQEALSKVIPEGQETLDPELVMSSQYVAVALTNAFVSGGINKNETLLLLNYNYDLPFVFDESEYTFTVFKPTPQPIVFGKEPGDVPVYRLEDESAVGTTIGSTGQGSFCYTEHATIDPHTGLPFPIPDTTTNPISNYNPPPSSPQYTETIISIPAKDINGNYILDKYGNRINQRYIIDPRLPVIAISPLWMKWAINDMCEKIIDNQEGNIRKEYFKVNQFYQDFKFYSDINIQNTNIGSILDNCLGAIPGEYTIDTISERTLPWTPITTTDFPNPLYLRDHIDNHPTYHITFSYPQYNNSLPIGVTTTVTTETISGIFDESVGISPTDSDYGKSYWYYREKTVNVTNYHYSTAAEPDASTINSWKLELNIHDIVLDDEKPSAPNWYIPEILIRTSEHQISRTGVDKFNTINVISPLDLGTAQVYPTVTQQLPTSNQYVRPIFNDSNGDFLGLSAMFPVTTTVNSYFYTSSSLSVNYRPREVSGQFIIDFGDSNVFTIFPSRSTPTTCNIYNSSKTEYYILTILWSNPLFQ